MIRDIQDCVWRLFLRFFRELGHLQLIGLLLIALPGPRCLASSIASTLTVTSTADSGAGSLRQALADAGDGNTIEFDPTLNGQTIGLTSDELVIDKNINVNGPGAALLSVSRLPASPPFRVFHIMPGHVAVIEGLTISGGHSSGEYGGGVLNDQATLTINQCTVTENFCDGGGGGGGIVSGGTLMLIDSVVSNNMSGFTFGSPVGDGGGVLGGEA